MSPMSGLATKCRLLVDPPADGAWNMAVDEVLLESAAEAGQATLRLYQWSEPTLSLGFFQPYDQRFSHEASGTCPLVRRITGGGAILHDQELTYSFVWPTGEGRPDGKWLYTLFHDTLQKVLTDESYAAWQPCKCSKAASGTEPFLCFQRRSAFDILVGDVKIVGSAQRRRRGSILQHGSLLLETSSRAPEVAGLGSQAGSRLAAGQIAALWPPRLADALDLELVPSPLSDHETRQAGQLVREKFGSDAWNRRR